MSDEHMSDEQLRGRTEIARLRVHLFASDDSAEELRFPENSYSVHDLEEAALAVHSLLANKGAGARAVLVEIDLGGTFVPQAVTPFVPPQVPGLAVLTDCLALTERNEHEGETWMFLVPVKGNEEAVHLVERYVEQVRDNEEYPYETQRLRVHLDTVGVVANHEGYRASHTIVPRLDLAKVQAKISPLLRDLPKESEGMDEEPDDMEGPDYAVEDPLYKGGLFSMCPDPMPKQDT